MENKYNKTDKNASGGEAEGLLERLRQNQAVLCQAAALPRQWAQALARQEREVQRRREVCRVHGALSSRRQRAAEALAQARRELESLTAQRDALERQLEKLRKKSRQAARDMDRLSLELNALGPMPVLAEQEEKLRRMEQEAAEQTRLALERQRAARKQMWQIVKMLEEGGQENGTAGNHALF